MNGKQALTKARAILGDRAQIRVDDGALAGDDRAAAIDAERLQRTETKTAEERMTARRAEVLAADAEYQQLKRAHADSKKRLDALCGAAIRRRVTIVTDQGFFYSVKAEADNFADAIDALQRRAS
jgi:hypothetical protein